MNLTNKDNLIWWLLKIGVFLTFFGHGVLAIQIQENWIYYLETVGFSNVDAINTLQIIGFLDITAAFIILIKPYKVIIIWAIFWAFSTALIRPIAGESIFSFVERGANWILPLALYIYGKRNNFIP